MKTKIQRLVLLSMFFHSMQQTVWAEGTPATVNTMNSLMHTLQNKQEGSLWLWLLFLLLSLVLGVVCIWLVQKLWQMRKKSFFAQTTDLETGMSNLQHFKFRLQNILNSSLRHSFYLAYIVIDGSFLRAYHRNTTFVEELHNATRVLSEEMVSKDFAGRVSENGFAFAFACPNEHAAMERMDRLLSRLNHLEDGQEKNDKLIYHSAVYHLAVEDKNCEILLFNLRKNCSKIYGTDQQVIFCDKSSMNEIREAKKMTDRLAQGLERNEFKMYLQFIVDNKTKQIKSAEALSRWNNPEKGVVFPGQYIENMELSGLISQHDFYMFERACQQLAKWHGTEKEKISISCNFTRITLSESDFLKRIEEIANRYVFDRTKLAIEITEDAIEKNMERATRNVMRCKELGFRVYLDDLGSGYTSLTNLCDYPIDIVKIDRDILRKTDTEKGRDLFGGVVALAHSLGIQVICEGVETEEQMSMVAETACDYVQGWYYAKAMPQEECESFICRHNERFQLA